jgi:membrane-associated protease RseP (regulator of RpoE activity)
LLTLLSTCAVGARFAHNFRNHLPVFRLEQDLLAFLEPTSNPALLLDGLPFSLSLLAILSAHEFGHYAFCLRYHLNATLPYFLPAPTFIGTFGAFIRIRSLIYNRRELFDVGVAGPIAGFAALLPLLVWGLAHSSVTPGIGRQGDLLFGWPLLMDLLASWIFPGVPRHDIALHPVAWAAWAGLFATALNLIPIGQLDGGHILYSLVGKRQALISRLFAIALFPCGFLWWPWFVWSLVLLRFARHPYIHDDEPLGAPRHWLAALALVIFLLSFMLSPTSIR